MKPLQEILVTFCLKQCDKTKTFFCHPPSDPLRFTFVHCSPFYNNWNKPVPSYISFKTSLSTVQNLSYWKEFEPLQVHCLVNKTGTGFEKEVKSNLIANGLFQQYFTKKITNFDSPTVWLESLTKIPSLNHSIRWKVNLCKSRSVLCSSNISLLQGRVRSHKWTNLVLKVCWLTSKLT